MRIKNVSRSWQFCGSSPFSGEALPYACNVIKRFASRQRYSHTIPGLYQSLKKSPVQRQRRPGSGHNRAGSPRKGTGTGQKCTSSTEGQCCTARNGSGSGQKGFDTGQKCAGSERKCAPPGRLAATERTNAGTGGTTVPHQPVKARVPAPPGGAQGRKIEFFSTCSRQSSRLNCSNTSNHWPVWRK